MQAWAAATLDVVLWAVLSTGAALMVSACGAFDVSLSGLGAADTAFEDDDRDSLELC